MLGLVSLSAVRRDLAGDAVSALWLQGGIARSDQECSDVLSFVASVLRGTKPAGRARLRSRLVVLIPKL